ncbi:hypothetical protein AB0H86_01520 [Streptomyces sp. NPDC050997]|uniref:hypothetical protein n=1 Tax=Streptomyces sp. NPDC050997 TaxID=3155519 RepID=UPI00343A9B44
MRLGSSSAALAVLLVAAAVTVASQASLGSGLGVRTADAATMTGSAAGSPAR